MTCLHCDSPAHSKGLCQSHYMRQWRYGDPLSEQGRGRWPKEPSEYIARWVDVGDCWEWKGATTKGYGRAHYQGYAYQAHRFVYESLVGPIPEDMTLDHLCRNRSCVNPDHLRILSNVENVMAGYGICAQRARHGR